MARGVYGSKCPDCGRPASQHYLDPDAPDVRGPYICAATGCSKPQDGPWINLNEREYLAEFGHEMALLDHFMGDEEAEAEADLRTKALTEALARGEVPVLVPVEQTVARAKMAAAAKHLSDALLMDPPVASRFDRAFSHAQDRPMPDQPDDLHSPPGEFAEFEALARHVVNVPKSAVTPRKRGKAAPS